MTVTEAAYNPAIKLLQSLIATSSFSREESETARIIAEYLTIRGTKVTRSNNNVWCLNHHFNESKPTILLNSHHDTVRPNQDYKRDPYTASIEDGKLYGLGSNDAGGAVVSLIETYLHFADQANLNFNLVLACTGEEEISGVNGIASIVNQMPEISFAVIGEPTLMQMAVAEKGLMVLDCTAHGKSGHAARKEGENAIYKAIKDIEWLTNYHFDQESELLGPVKMTTTMIEAGSQHNVVPDTCKFVVDVRTTDAYSNQETLAIIQNNTLSEVVARSTSLNPSGISLEHPLIQAGQSLGLTTYGSPTLSDQALLDLPSIKLGPGDSARSHTADEFIYLEEIKQGIETYINLLTQLLTKL